MHKTLVLGGPGAGKTERLLRKIESAIKAGARPDRIAFVSFTRAAVELAKRRACDAFGLLPDDLPHFRTVHSLAFRELGMGRDDVVDNRHLSKVAELTGELVSSLEDPFSDAPAAGMQGDPLLTLDHYARTTCRDLASAWSDHGSDLEWFRLLRFHQAYAAYKDDEGVLDFTDMLVRYVDSPVRPLTLDLAVVDEAQDLSRRQWQVVMKAFSNTETMIVSGDDLQMIHHWAGADEEKFLSLASEGFEIENLSLSHRLPRIPFALAAGIGSRIEKQYQREWYPSSKQGSVDWVNSADETDLSDGSWLMMARTRSQLTELSRAARDQGVAYEVKGEKSVVWADVVAIKAHEALRSGRSIGRDDAEALGKAAGCKFDGFDGERTAAELGYDAARIWHDALGSIPLERREYYLTIMRRGGKLTDDPKVRIDTIHGAKGSEAEGVVLCTDMTYRTSRAMEVDPDSENRVLYVGLTRVLDRMVLVVPQSQYGYRI